MQYPFSLCVHISAHFKYSMLLRVQIAPQSYCSVAPWLETPPSFTVSIGANSIMDNAIVEAMSSKRMMLHMHITLMSYVSFSIEPLACHGSKQPSSLTLVANGTSTILGNAVMQMLLSCKCCFHANAVFIAPTPNHWPLSKRCHPNAFT